MSAADVVGLVKKAEEAAAEAAAQVYALARDEAEPWQWDAWSSLRDALGRLSAARLDIEEKAALQERTD